MDKWREEILRRLTGVKLSPAREAEIVEEVAQHLEDRYQELVVRGSTEDEAQRMALEELKGEDLLARGLRRVEQEMKAEPLVPGGAGDRFLASIWQDIRYGSRMLAKNRAFTAVAACTLALGIGANTAIFSVVNGVLLRPLAYPSPGSLVSVQEAGSTIGNPASYPDFFDWQAQNRVFSNMASYNETEFTLTGVGEPAHIQALIVSAGLFQLLEVKPLMGRGFEPRDDQRGQHVVVLSHFLWRQRFHSDPTVVGRSITLNNQSFTVVGVMPAGFQFPPNIRKDLWTSIAVDREAPSNIMTGRGYHALSVIARLKPGIGLEQAQADMDLIARRLAQGYPETNAERTTVRIMPEIDRVVGSVRLPLLVILGVVGGVLLIACVNLANLSLARNLSRQKEIAVRAALGANRRRIVGQLLTESLLLSLLGGASGIALAAWGMQGLLRIAPEDLPRIGQVSMDWRVLAFAVGLSLVTGIVFGSLPALRASKTNLVESLKGAGSAASEGVSQRRLRGTLVAVETALAVILLVAAGLLISSYVRLVHVDPGFNPENLLTFNFDLPMPPYTMSGAATFVDQLLSRLRALRGVRSAATDWALPFSGSYPYTAVDFEGRSFPPGKTPGARLDSVTPEYFQTMGIPLLAGRTFTELDNAVSPPVVIVNDAFARLYFPDQNAVGKRIQPSFSVTSEFPWREIVGVVGNTKQGGLAEDFQPKFYFPFAQVPNLNAVILRTEGNPLEEVSAVRSILASMDKSVPVYDVETMQGYLASSVARNRFSTLLLGLFGALALVLAAVGIYGVVSYSVSQSTHEIGIRMALGADRRNVLTLELGQGLKLALIGVVTGAVGALALTRFLSSLLFGVKPTDPMTFIVVSLVLIAVALLASYIPARRATKVDPMVALRYE